MANKKNWARRNKKSNNWRAMLKLKKEKKENESSKDTHHESFDNHSANKTIEPVNAENISESTEENGEWEDIHESTASKRKKNVINKESAYIQVHENYFNLLGEDDGTCTTIIESQMTDDFETNRSSDPLSIIADEQEQDVDSSENIGDDNHDENIEENFEDDDDNDNVEECNNESGWTSANESEDENEDRSIGENGETSEDENEDRSPDENAEPSDSNQVEEEPFNGRRIFDIGDLFQRLQAIGRHSKHCSFSDMDLVGETKRGLNSIFKFMCRKCGMRRKLESCPKKQNSLNCNEDAVLGITSIGSGYYHLKEFLTNLDIPVIGNTLYDKIQKRQQCDWSEIAQKSAMDALNEEIVLAKAILSTDSAGNALIPVICDGGWGKRSYGKAFNSLSGCAVLIGERTGKVLYFGVRNKYCHVCKLAQSRCTPPNFHECNINYEGPSSGMESNIISEGFKFCEQFGARFHKLICDGDSNTYKHLRDTRVYRNPDVFVEKCECCNHLHRNFRSKFACLSQITKFDNDLRKHVKPSKGHDISTGIKMAAKHWRESGLEESKKIRKLEDDIMNAPAHYFGVHHNCRSYFCTKPTSQTSIDNLKALKEDGLYYEVLNLCQNYFGGHAKSLLQNYTNNRAEQFNNIVAKFIGGKRINFSLGGSYSARVAQAVVQYNSEGHLSTVFRTHKFGSVQSTRLEKMENSRKRKILQNAIDLQSKPRLRHIVQDNSTKVTGTYFHGDGTEDVDMEPDVFEKAKKVFLEKLEFNQRNRNLVEESTRGGKHNSRWQQIRQDMVPSTFVSKIVLSKTKKSYKNHLDELIYKRSEFGNSAAIKHQRLVEREAIQFFQTLFDDALEDCGIFVDDEMVFLCASPLKLYGHDHTLNIKCPLKEYRKKFDDVIGKLPFWDSKTGDLNKKHEWYIELQCELHATGRKYCFLMVWLGECEGRPQYRIVEVPKNDSFFDTEVRPKLTYFYNEVMVKELVDSRKRRHMSLREYNAEKDCFI